MAFQPAVDCAEAVIHITSSAGEQLNVLNFKYPTAYDQSNLDDLSAAVDAVVGGTYLSLMNEDMNYAFTHVRGLTSSVDLESVNGDNAGAGTDSAGALPANVAFCMSLRTGFTGRSARGRFYAMGLSTDQLVTLNHVTSTYVTNLHTMLTDILGAAATAGWTLVVLSRQNGGVKLSAAVARPVTSIIAVDTVLDSQRRRLPGRGD